MNPNTPTPAIEAPANPSWLRALAFSAAASYGPQLLMGIYTLCAVDCRHCRATVWQFMAVAPGLEAILPAFLNLRLHLSMSAFTTFSILGAVSLVLLLCVATWLRHCPRWRWWISGGVFLLFSFGAFVLLCLIRA
jgi:hypothetical protein